MDAETSKHFKRPPWRPEAYTYDAEVRGGKIALKCKQRFPKMSGGGRRGRISTFTAQSRMRMFKMTATIDWTAARTGVFITLTFPDACLPMLASERMRALWEFFRRLETYLGHQVSALWRVEWLPRESGRFKGQAMPHFHLIVFDVRYFPYNVCNWTWKEVLGRECWEYTRTECERLSNERQHGAYIAKYAAKLPSSLVSVAYSRIDGKHWGYYRLKNLPRATMEYFTDVPLKTVRELRAMAAEHLRWYDPQTDLGFCILTRFGRRLARRALQLLLDSEAVSV